MIKNILIVVTSVLILSCQTLNFPNDEVLNERENLRSQRSNIDDDWIEAGLEYDSHYASALEGNPGAKYYPVWFDSIGSRMNGLIFVPGNQTKGTIIAIHGFAGNIRGYRFYIRELLKEGYTVAALSLPGHGLAGGDRGDIENFDDYGKVVLDFISSLRGKIPEPFYAIGHSTGCTSLLIYNEKYGWDLEKIVFISPLIRSSLWYPSKITRFFFKPFIHYYNTPWHGALAVQVFPMHWFDELVKWNKTIFDYAIHKDKILLFQGEEDKVVSWKYNIKFVKEKYPNTVVIKYPGANHTFFMNENDVQKDLIEKTLSYFNE